MISSAEEGDVRGFSFASVLLSFLMIAGGVAAASMVLAELNVQTASSDVILAGIFGGGALLGGFFAARASRGSTIAGPAIAAVLVVGGLCAVVLATPVGRMVYHLAQDQLTRMAAICGGAALVGAVLGAFVSEKLLGEATTSSIPWILYVAIAVMGGCFLSTLGAIALHFGDFDSSTVGGQVETGRAEQTMILAGIGAGCLIAGLASGASARIRVLIAAFLGAVAGVFGFFVLVGRFSRSALDSDALVGAAVIAVGGGLIAVLSAAIGWVAVGRRGTASGT